MTQTSILQSFIGGRWIGSTAAQPLRSAVDGHVVASTHDEALDFGEALVHARRTGLPALLALDFQQRAARLKALAAYLLEHKESLYAISAHTGATRADSRAPASMRSDRSRAKCPAKGLATIVEKTSGSLMLNSDGIIVARPSVLFFLDLAKSI